MEWVETTGKTVEEAKDAALDRLGVDEQDAEFEIVEEPRAGLFGRTRSAVLLQAARPGRHTTSTIARQVGISVSSSSEHLSALRAAGLVASRRDGGAIVHRATALCRELVSLPGE